MDSNGSNPYPSPPSTSNSPNIADEPVTAPISSISRLATISEASRETQRHLQHTSAALDAAYSRIRQIRRSLLELSETLPATLSHLRAPDSRWPVPGQNANAFSRLPGSQPPDEELDGREQGRGMVSRHRVQSDAHHDRISSDISMSEGLLHSESLMDIPQRTGLAGTSIASFSQGDPQPPPRMQVGPNHFAERDDGSTTLGRRVATRMAIAPTVTDTVFSTNRSTGDAGQLYEEALNPTAAVTINHEEEIERVLRALNEQRRISPTVPLRATPRRASIPARTLSQDPPQLYPRRSSQGTTHLASPNLSSNPQGNLSPGTVPNSVRQNSGSSERVSLLSNYSVQNFPTRSTSNLPNPPLLFNEPLSYVPSETAGNSLESRYLLTSEPAFRGRHYVVHRTRNRTGEELVHNITVNWDEGEPMSWSMPSPNISRRHRNRFSSPRQTLDVLRTTDPVATLPPPPLPIPENSNSSAHPSDHPRRRGWARLDLDGNEIPSDEEEEVERVRTESRIRASQRSHNFAPVVQTANMTTLSAPPPRQLTIYQNIKPPVVLRHEPSLSYPADFVNPLPMPLSEMVDQGKNAQRKATLLPRHTIVAGR